MTRLHALATVAVMTGLVGSCFAQPNRGPAPAGFSWNVEDTWKGIVPDEAGKWPVVTAADTAGYRNAAAGMPAHITADCGHFPKEGHENAFDGTAAKWCAREATVLLTYAYADGVARHVTAYTLTSANDHPGRDPRAWELRGSNDGTSWDRLDAQTDQVFLARHLRRLFKISKPGRYSQYRLAVLGNHGEDITQLEELELLIPAEPDPEMTADDRKSLIAQASDPDGYRTLFEADLSNATMPENAWAWHDGVLTVADGGDIWTQERYGDFALDLEFLCAENTNSGVFLRCRSISDWLNTAIEVQIQQAVLSNERHNCGAIFDCLAPTKHALRPAGQWNRYLIVCRANHILVMLNGELVNDMDLNAWQEPGKNPDGSKNKFRYAYASLARSGHIGLQYHGQPIAFRNIRIKTELK